MEEYRIDPANVIGIIMVLHDSVSKLDDEVYCFLITYRSINRQLSDRISILKKWEKIHITSVKRPASFKEGMMEFSYKIAQQETKMGQVTLIQNDLTFDVPKEISNGQIRASFLTIIQERGSKQNPKIGFTYSELEVD